MAKSAADGCAEAFILPNAQPASKAHLLDWVGHPVIDHEEVLSRCKGRDHAGDGADVITAGSVAGKQRQTAGAGVWSVTQVPDRQSQQ